MIKKKIKILLVLFIFIVSLQGLSNTGTASKIVGEFLSDGSFMIVYEAGVTGSLDVKKAFQQGSTLAVDSFRTFIGGGSLPFTSSIYVEVHRFNGTYKWDNATFKYAIDPILVQKGINDDGNPYYFDTKINLLLSEDTELVVFRYLEKVLLFKHKTSEFEIPVESTSGIITFTLALAFVIGIVVAIASFGISVGLWKRYLWIPRLPYWLVAIVFLLAFSSFLTFLLFDLNFNFEQAAVSLIKNLGIWIAFPLFIFLISVFGNELSVHSDLVKRALIFVLYYNKESNAVYKLLKLDDVIEKNGELFHVHTRNDMIALKEFVLAVFGYRHKYQDYNSIELDDIPEYESDVDKLILATSYRKEEGEFLKISTIGKRLYLIPVVGLVLILIAYGIDSAILRLGQYLGLILSIGMIVLVIGLILILIDAKINTTPPTTVLDPIIDEEVLELLLKIDIVKQLKKRIRSLRASLLVSDLNTDLESLIDIEAVISGKNPEEILKFLSETEDMAGDAELIYYGDNDQPFRVTEEPEGSGSDKKDKKFSKKVGEKL